MSHHVCCLFGRHGHFFCDSEVQLRNGLMLIKDPERVSKTSPQCIRACDARSSWDVKLRELARRLANILKARAVMVSVSGSIPGVESSLHAEVKDLGPSIGQAVPPRQPEFRKHPKQDVSLSLST